MVRVSRTIARDPVHPAALVRVSRTIARDPVHPEILKILIQTIEKKWESEFTG
jgi:hypothetical protein